jgi:hypothetical protein
MQIVSILGFAVCVACFASGCATSSRNQPQHVEEIQPGTYSIGINRSGKTLFSSNDKVTIDEAVDKAGDYCHSKGQNLLVKTAVANSIVFQCVPGDQKHQ